MKAITLVASLLIATTTFASSQKTEGTSADLDTIKVCNPKNKADSLEMTVQGSELNVVKTPGPEIIVSTIERRLE